VRVTALPEAAKDAPEGMTQDEFRFKSTAVNITPFYLTNDFTDSKLVLTSDQARKALRSKEYAKYFPKQIMPKFFLTVEQDNEKAAIFTDINNYVNQMKSRWITGNGNIQSEWDEYVKTLDKMGVSKYVKMHQELYDSYNSKK
jgi:putative aldouronate transport system substrate-binding protein